MGEETKKIKWINCLSYVKIF